MKPLNGNVIVKQKKKQDNIDNVFGERKDLHLATVEAFCEGSSLKIGEVIVYHERDLDSIIHEGDLKGIIHEGRIKCIL